MTTALPPRTPTVSVLLLCEEAAFAVELQCQRLSNGNPHDPTYSRQWRVDFLFLLMSLYRLRSLAERVARQSGQADLVQALHDFDSRLPSLLNLHGALAYTDSCALESEPALQHLLHGGHWDGQCFRWLGAELDTTVAPAASQALLEAVLAA